MNDGKRLERIVKLVEEAFKNSEDTVIHHNYKIENTSNNERQIDVLIVSKINTYEVKIAIECKDYKVPISVDKIESFHSKCLRIPEINKKVFISSNGFQKDAIAAAADFGIELKIAEELSVNDFSGWFPVHRLTLKYINEFGDTTLVYGMEETLHANEQLLPDKIYHRDDQVDLSKIITKGVMQNGEQMQATAFALWIEFNEELKYKPFFVPFKIILNDFNIELSNGRKIRLAGVKSSMKVVYEEAVVKITDKRNIMDLNGDVQAKTISLQLEDGTKADFVKDKNDQIKIFVSKEDKKNEN